ncbi:hydrogenase expression/formation protein HypE [Natronoarchaeum philippinense]|uniref:Hydrogenase expression/formation protein HypE n=1 Tax=Natronoarchaeum philippinense TaxID=558529 RepID=A0A285NFY6_NATPI|nr:AIR synthase family protein [Natronoarchaeum philippinense]SNZ06796.1 hydrogenase expression/formation protein HypE [Natronoarchaeum philippinense]
MVGKVDQETLARVLAGTGASSTVLGVGPGYGEDAAAIELGEQTLVISADPISLAAERIGTLGVNVACNDVAASGGDPEWLTSVLLLPGDADDAMIDAIVADLDREARSLGATIVGGHTEYVDQLERPLLSLTAIGTTDRFVPTGGADPGDRVVLTKGAGIEATAILATDFAAELDVPDDAVSAAATFFEEISVVPESRILGAHATAMHDPTEGGVLGGLVEMAHAAAVGIEVERSAIPVRAATEQLCAAAGVDPLRTFGSGALLATLPEAQVDETMAALDDADIEAAEIGRVVEREQPGIELDGERFENAPRDELYALWE